jgi:serine protease AprX
MYSIDVVNLSFGNDSKQSWRYSPLNYAVEKAWDAGIVVVVSAGNLGDGAGTVSKPADDPLVISVGASDDKDTATVSDDDIPTFVSRGPTQDGLAKPDLTAPGTHLVSLRAPGSTVDVENPSARVGETGFRGSGTSFSTPVVAGAIAQMLSADPTLAPDEIKYALMQTGSQILGDAAAQGAGSIDVAQALRLAHQGRAVQPTERSDGSGSLDGTRGSAKVEITSSLTSSTLSLTDLLTLSDGILKGPITGELGKFDRGEFLSSASWDASRWGASRWGSSQWTASRWGASRWGASRWGAANWWASRWG